MTKIKYIKANKFFAKEYKDGTIVAFKNIGDNSPSYADQIHQIVLKSFGVDLFVSDIIESISGTDTHKGCIKDSLFIHVKKGVSISACGISLCPNKDYIEVKYNSEFVLFIKNKQSNKLWEACILLIICIFGYNIILDNDKTNDNQSFVDGSDAQSQTEQTVKEETDDNVSVNGVPDNNKKDTLTITNYTNLKIEAVVDERHVKNENNISTSKQIMTPNVSNEINSSVEYKKKHDQEVTQRDRQRKALYAEADNYLGIADQAYNDFANSFDESKGIIALTNYKKALDLNKKHGLFLVSERERIEQKVNILEKELK